MVRRTQFFEPFNQDTFIAGFFFIAFTIYYFRSTRSFFLFLIFDSSSDVAYYLNFHFPFWPPFHRPYPCGTVGNNLKNYIINYCDVYMLDVIDRM